VALFKLIYQRDNRQATSGELKKQFNLSPPLLDLNDNPGNSQHSWFYLFLLYCYNGISGVFSARNHKYRYLSGKKWTASRIAFPFLIAGYLFKGRIKLALGLNRKLTDEFHRKLEEITRSDSPLMSP
jgi:hypothetical protein